MCGITGIFAFNEVGRFHMINLSRSIDHLEHRGPNARGMYTEDKIGLGHRRLSILDLRPEANQPMRDVSGRYRIVYNGEIFNYKELRNKLEIRGVEFTTHCDTEVLLYAFIEWGPDCLEELNGFFAFAIFDMQEQSLFLARDRFGIKPLYFYLDEDKFLFASEIRSILGYGIDKQLDYTALYTYFQLQYIPAPQTIFSNVQMLLPGHCLNLKNKNVNIKPWYQIAYKPDLLNPKNLTYDQQLEQVRVLTESSVQKRLMSDVPLGTYLSGGIDSSIITGLAARHKPDLHCFSVGFKDAAFFDETAYASEVAKHFGVEHTVFYLGNEELQEAALKIGQQMDQPFADSSAIPVYLLNQYTSKHLKVVLSGDGADELFSGYNKHAAFLRASMHKPLDQFVASMAWFWNLLPASRNSFLTNKIRQMQRFSNGYNLPVNERYWQWASILTAKSSGKLYSDALWQQIDQQHFQSVKDKYTGFIKNEADLNEILLADMTLVLPNDMLYKVDQMSMRHGLEVRVPFLDHELVDFVFKLPAESKINATGRKRLLRDAYRDFLPESLYNRPKKGFELPLLDWLKGSMKNTIKNDLLSDDFIRAQGIFNPASIQSLRKKLFSSNPGDTAATVWAIMVFQWWWKRHME